MFDHPPLLDAHLSPPAARRSLGVARLRRPEFATITVAILATLGLLATLLLAAPTAPAGASTSAAGPPTMLILDASGSMVRDAPGGGTRMDQARSAAVTFVDSLADDQTLGLMVFGTKTGNADADKPAGCRDVTTLFPLGPVDKPSMTSSIRGIKESGYTPLGLAVETAASAIGDQAANIVLVSDGVDACAPPPSCDRVQTVKAQYPKLTIHAIGFAVDADEQAQEELNCIARVGGGQYVTASNAAQLASQLQWATDPTLLQDKVAPGGVNALAIGMTIEEARAAEPSLVITDPALEVVYADCAYATMRFVDGRLYDIYPKHDWPTGEGINIGASIDDATAIYGAPYRSGTGSFGTFNTYPVTFGSSYAYRIYYLDGVITKITICKCGPGAAQSSGANAVEAGFEGINDVLLGMSAHDFLATYPDAKFWAGEGYDVPLGTLEDALAQGEGLGDKWVCPMTVSPYAEHKPSVPLEVLIVQGEVVGIKSTFHGTLTQYGNGITPNSSLDDVRAAYGHVTIFTSDYFGDRWVVTDDEGRTVQFSISDQQGIGAVSVLAPDYSLTSNPPIFDWAPCLLFTHRLLERS